MRQWPSPTHSEPQCTRRLGVCSGHGPLPWDWVPRQAHLGKGAPAVSTNEGGSRTKYEYPSEAVRRENGDALNLALGHAWRRSEKGDVWGLRNVLRSFFLHGVKAVILERAAVRT